MAFDLNDLNPSRRFFWGDEEVEYVDFKLVSDDKMQEIRKIVGLRNKQKYVPNPTTKRMDVVHDMDLSDEAIKKLNDETIVYQIDGWKLNQPDGTLIPCTDENKKKLYYGSPVFAKWANRCLEKMQGEIEEIQEAEVKN